MKKKLLVVVMALASVAALTGCEKKENKGDETTTTTKAAASSLSCSMTEDDETIRVILTYDGNQISKTSMSSSEKYKTDKEAKKAYEELQKLQKTYNAYDGLSVNISYSNTLVNTTLSFTVAKLDEDAKGLYDEYFKDIKDKSLEDAKSAYTSAGFTCK